MKNLKSKFKILLWIKDQGSRINNKSGGFVILFTVLVASIVMLITIGISNITYREALLASEARDSSLAFFAADSGAECVLYADFKQNAYDAANPKDINCLNQIFAQPNNFDFFLSANNGANCAHITVDKSNPVTVVESRGYNIDCLTVQSGVLPPKTVERAIQVTY